MTSSAILLLLALLPLKGSTQDNHTNDNSLPFFVGTYTNTSSKGIYQYTLDPQTGILRNKRVMAQCTNPSFLALNKDGNILLAVNEVNTNKGCGTVESYEINEEKLRFISRSSSGGAHPCFVAVNQQGVVLTANYSGGNVGLLHMSPKGELSPLLDTQEHNTPKNGTSEKSAHAHSVYFLPQQQRFLSADLGNDEIWCSKWNSSQKKIISKKTCTTPTQKGAGPRHMAFHPNGKWVYVINELNSTVSLYDISTKCQLTPRSNYSTLPTNFQGKNYPGDVHISDDGKYLYGSNRGHNSIAIFAIDQTSGKLSLVSHESTRGDWPRNFSLSPQGKFLLVANQKSDNIICFARDLKTGMLQYRDSIQAPIPACILFMHIKEKKEKP